MRTGDPVVYACDQCSTQEPARVIHPRDSDFTQAIQPVGWFTLEARYSATGGKSPRLRADVCSVRCAHAQIDDWADSPLTPQEERHARD